MSGQKWRVRCRTCEWRGVRTDGECECYPDYAAYCRPGTPGPGCPRGVAWSCPRCGYILPTTRFPKGSTVVAVAPVQKRAVAK